MATRAQAPEIVDILHGHRPYAKGKFIFCGDAKLYVRGVTYGTFRPGDDGSPFPEPAVVAEDFDAMVRHGVNTVRTYTPPPRWLLDMAAECGLRVMVGLPWAQHVAFLDDRELTRSIEDSIGDGVRACSSHPALLCYAVGNEIPASIVRWHGKRQIEQFIERLYHAAKSADEHALVTYVNYPSTEYLELPFLDIASYNVFLERPAELEAYIARLHNVVGDRPLLLTELGLDSQRHGERAQAASIARQLRAAFQGGSAGACVFSWTDEWHRGGHDVLDWGFGLTERDRAAKPSLGATASAFRDVPFGRNNHAPHVTVAVCTYNGAATLRECLEGIRRLDYPNYDTIVVDDGSTDASAAIAGEYDVRVVQTENHGLSSARNTALALAGGEIVAYIDDDAVPDAHWLSYLVRSFDDPAVGAAGGPNIPPEGQSLVAECVAHAPGGPQHVLVSDTDAEHIPGCNMAFRRDSLRAMGGFDSQFRVAGDDVDICWRYQQAGWKLRYNPAAVVWHRRRASIRTYLKQQAGYGRAEALLERKWPEKYNGSGHVSWGGRVYGNGLSRMSRFRVYYGTWGSSAFQSIYQRRPITAASLPLMPEWYLLIAIIAAMSVYEMFRPLAGSLHTGFSISLVLLVAAVAALVVSAFVSVRHAFSAGPSRWVTGKRRTIVALLFVLQPLARLSGRLRYGLTPWRMRTPIAFTIPWPRSGSLWSETWRSSSDRLHALESELRRASAVVRNGPADRRWDLQIRTGALGWARLRLAVEEHGDGLQLIRYRVWPRLSVAGVVVATFLGALCALMAIENRPLELSVLAAVAALVATRMLVDLSGAMGVVRLALTGHEVSGSTDLVEELEGRLPGGAAVPGVAHMAAFKAEQ